MTAILFSVTLFIVYFKSPGPWFFGRKKKKYSINFCDSYIFEKVRTVQFFWCVNKENSLKNEVDYFLQNACAVSSSSRSSSPSLYTRSRESRLSGFTFHLCLEISQAEAARPTTSVTWIPLPFTTHPLKQKQCSPFSALSTFPPFRLQGQASKQKRGKGQSTNLLTSCDIVGRSLEVLLVIHFQNLAEITNFQNLAEIAWKSASFTLKLVL